MINRFYHDNITVSMTNVSHEASDDRENGSTREPADVPFADLSPDAILNAIDPVLETGEWGEGVRTSGQVIALNSYENRVFQIGLESISTSSEAHAVPRALVAKFYRPARWTDRQIQEEHDFLFELVDAEVPAVAPLQLGGASLHHAGAFRFALFERRGGRAPELSHESVRERVGRFLGRLHAVGARAIYDVRPQLDADTFGREPSQYLMAHEWLPPELAGTYRGLVTQAIEEIERSFARAAPLRMQRVHGDCHLGNLLWNEAQTEAGPLFLDFDDSVMAPAVQDLWMLLSGDRDEMQMQLRDVLRGYEMFAPFDRSQLLVIEAMRTLRLIHYAAWIARRWSDPAFPAAFPWFPLPRYWESRILELREQIAAMQEPPLEV